MLFFFLFSCVAKLIKWINITEGFGKLSSHILVFCGELSTVVALKFSTCELKNDILTSKSVWWSKIFLISLQYFFSYFSCPQFLFPKNFSIPSCIPSLKLLLYFFLEHSASLTKCSLPTWFLFPGLC